MSTQEKTRFELFAESARADLSAYRDKLKGDGAFEYINQVRELERLSSHLSGNMLTYLFGDQLGSHLAEKFVVQCNRNLLFFLPKLTSEYRFFILYELKNNPYLFAHA